MAMTNKRKEKDEINRGRGRGQGVLKTKKRRGNRREPAQIPEMSLKKPAPTGWPSAIN